MSEVKHEPINNWYIELYGRHRACIRLNFWRHIHGVTDNFPEQVKQSKDIATHFVNEEINWN